MIFFSLRISKRATGDWVNLGEGGVFAPLTLSIPGYDFKSFKNRHAREEIQGAAFGYISAPPVTAATGVTVALGHPSHVMSATSQRSRVFNVTG